MKQPGEQCRVYYDTDQDLDVLPGDYLRTLTGRTYLIDAVRVQQGGRNVGRRHLRVTVMGPDLQVLDDDVVHTIRWYSRKQRR